MKRSYLIAASIALIAFFWVLSGMYSSTPEEDEKSAGTPEKSIPQVRTKHLTAMDKVGDVVLFGRTEADRKVDVRVETTGRIERLVKRKGDLVSKGDVIARLVMDDRTAKRREAQSSVEHYKLAYEAARKLSKKAFRSRVQLAEAKSKLEKAKSGLASIRLDIRRTVIRAPFAGVLDDLPVEEGAFVNTNTVIGTVADLDPIVVVGEVTERHQPVIQRNAQAWVRFVDGKRRNGKIRFLSKVGVTKTRTFRIEATIPNPDGKIAEGLTTELHIPTTKVRAHLISPAVLTLSKDGVLGVKTVKADQTVVFHPAKLVADTADGVWVSGLPDQITLITVGQEYVKAGQRVQSIPENQPKSPAPDKQSVPLAGVKP